MKRIIVASMSLAMLAGVTLPASADVPVIDKTTLAQTKQITKHTEDILKTDKLIKEATDKILEAVTGNRTESDAAKNTALGSGFQSGKAPKFADILGGGGMNFGQLGGDFQQIAATLINGMKLVKQLKQVAAGTESTGNQKSYEALINTATSLAGIVSGSQQAVADRSSAFEQAGAQIGQEKDVKGAVALNSMVALQQAQTMNEAIGAITALNGAEQAKLMKRLSEESGGMEMFQYER